jgi:hypothetical protein
MTSRKGNRNIWNDASVGAARKHGWSLRYTTQGYYKCFDPRTCDVTFATTTRGAVYGMIRALEHCKEYGAALKACMK